MAASKLYSCAAMAAAGASLSTLSDRAYADSFFRFPPFFSSSSSSTPPPPDQITDAKSESQASAAAEEPRGSGFDPEALERGAKALREINSSTYAKQVFFFLLYLIRGANFVAFTVFC